MDIELSQLWIKFQTDMVSTKAVDSLAIFCYLILGGVLSIYYRFLYHRFSVSASNTDSVTRVFPLLTLVTIGVIAVVKSSLALSLGLVGALSIVRFRAAIKEPEELVYLFLCIGTGLCLGAGTPLLAFVIAIASTLFIVIPSFSGMAQSQYKWMVTITGNQQSPLQNNLDQVTSSLTEVFGNHDIQRLDTAGGHCELRVLLNTTGSKNVSAQIQTLKEKLPDCELSYFNLNAN